jgi:hypothetical protein
MTAPLRKRRWAASRGSLPMVGLVLAVVATNSEFPMLFGIAEAAAAAGIFGGRRDSGAAKKADDGLPPPPPLPPGGPGGSHGVAHIAKESLPDDHYPILPTPPILSMQSEASSLEQTAPNFDGLSSMAEPNDLSTNPTRFITPPPPPPPPSFALKSTLDRLQMTPDAQWNQQSVQSGSWPGSPSQQSDYSPLQLHNDLVQEQQYLDDHQQLYLMQRDLEEALQREQQLREALNNMTVLSAARQQRETLHMHQLDVLTERVMQVETSAASDHLQLLEYQANCTELSMQLASSHELVQKWRTQCESLQELRSADEAKIIELQVQIKAATNEAEELAAMIEQNRHLREGTTKKQKKRGFFAWLFGFGKTDDDDEEDDNGDGSFENARFSNNPSIKKMHDIARSTLLAALRTERNSVSELESVVTTLQQNNSAIAEQVQSRDDIINELNDRIAVFEEDKVVLKAALRQLQLEMNEEAPKVQKLADDLADAEKEVDRLVDEIDALRQAHSAEIAALELVIDQKQEAIKAAESNLTVIGTYVDKLEERLGDFTVARRDIEGREIAFSEAESKVHEVTSQRDGLQVRVRELENEHDELKKLLEELAQERAKLQKENAALSSVRSTLQKDVQSLRQSYAKLDNEAKSLRESAGTERSLLDKVHQELRNATLENSRLQERLDMTQVEIAQLRNWSESVAHSQIEHDKLLRQATATQQSLEQRIAELEAERLVSEQLHLRTAQESQLKVQELNREVVIAREKAANETRRALKAAQIGPRIPMRETRSRTHERDSNGTLVGADTNTTVPVEGNKPDSASLGSNGTANKVSDCRTQPAEVPLVPAPRREFGSASLHAVVTANSTTTNATNVATVYGTIHVATVNQTTIRRNVPLRQVRKFFARSTGMHGVFTKPSAPRTKANGPQVKPPLRAAKKSTSQANDSVVSGEPTAAAVKPNEVRPTMWGMKYQKPRTNKNESKS